MKVRSLAVRLFRGAWLPALIAFAGCAGKTAEEVPEGTPEAAEMLMEDDAIPEFEGPPVSEEAARILKATSDFLAGQEKFSFTAYETIEDLTELGQRIQYANTREVRVRRPDHFRVDTVGDLMHREVYYDGKSVTLHEAHDNVYVRKDDVPPTIDELLRVLEETEGIAVPLGELIAADLYAAVEPGILVGVYAGEGRVRDTPCHHLLFRSQGADWQLWVETGDRPLPRKIVITYRHAAGAPQFSAELENWNLAPALSDATFSFDPPEGMERIQFFSGYVPEHQASGADAMEVK